MGGRGDAGERFISKLVGRSRQKFRALKREKNFNGMEREGKVGMGLCACLQLKSVWFGACLLGSIWLGILFFFFFPSSSGVHLPS